MGTHNELCNTIFYFRKLQAPRSAPNCGATCGMPLFAGFVDIIFGHFRPTMRYGIIPRGLWNLFEMLPIYSSYIWHKFFDPARRVPATIWRNPRRHKHSRVSSNSGLRPRHSSPKRGWKHENDFIVMGNVHQFMGWIGLSCTTPITILNYIW